MTAGLAAFFSTTVLGASVYLLLWSFLIYSFVGVVVEMVFCLVVEGVLESRTGLLYVPLRPIYGVGGASCVVLLHLTREPAALFICGMLVGSAVEYGSALVAEKAFGTVSWNYSDKRCNVHGRICLQYSLGWGLLAMLVGYLLDPFFSRIVGAPDRQIGENVLTVLMLLTLLAAMVTAAALTRLRKHVAALQARFSGQPVTVSTRSWDRLIDRPAPAPIMINSFPRASLTAQYMTLTGTQRRWIRIPACRGMAAFVRREVPHLTNTAMHVPQRDSR